MPVQINLSSFTSIASRVTLTMLFWRRKCPVTTVPTPNSRPAFAGSASPLPYFWVDADGRISSECAWVSAFAISSASANRRYSLAASSLLIFCSGNTAIVRLFAAAFGILCLKNHAPIAITTISSTAANPTKIQFSFEFGFWNVFVTTCSPLMCRNPLRSVGSVPFFSRTRSAFISVAFL